MRIKDFELTEVSEIGGIHFHLSNPHLTCLIKPFSLQSMHMLLRNHEFGGKYLRLRLHVQGLAREQAHRVGISAVVGLETLICIVKGVFKRRAEHPCALVLLFVLNLHLAALDPLAHVQGDEGASIVRFLASRNPSDAWALRDDLSRA